MPNNFYIKNQDHFQLYVGLKDNIIFEAELFNNGIDFHVDGNQALTSSDTRYFLLTKDIGQINKIIMRNAIISSTDIICVSDYRDEKKKQKIYLYFFLAILLFFILLILL